MFEKLCVWNLRCGQALILLGLLLWLDYPWAAQLTRLYEAEVPVASQGSGERAEALPRALEQVLVRMTGDRGITQQPAAASLMKDPARYVQQYRYRQVAGPEEGELSPLRFWVRFDGASLERALRNQGLPFWGQERPETMVWLAVERGEGRVLVSEQGYEEFKRPLAAAARRRGLPLIFPLMDLEDRSQVSSSDVWGGFLDRLAAASARYRPQATLVGRVHRARSGAWSARWTLRVQGVDRSWSDARADLDTLLGDGLEVAADELAARFAVRDSAGARARFLITVDGVRGLEDYAELNRYLQGLTPVERVQLVRLAGEQAEYQIELRGEEQAFGRAVAMGGRLEPLDPTGRNFRLRP